MKPAIQIRNLGKQYKLSTSEPYIALRDVITNGFRNIFSSNKKTAEKFWALKDIDLDILPGERVGIIGRNGAGKSTLLKIISRITPPTTGEVLINGRVGSLLEVGTGFHPELTGRENIYLNGSILGLKKAEINKHLDEIIDFSGVEKFIDTPLKRYSSGMQMRLAFSVAAHLQSEILLVDEVLAVGDMEFQKKCIGKMEEVSKSEGRTILFVSHDLNAVSVLTEKTIYLEFGGIKSYGQTKEVIQRYLQEFKNITSEYTRDKKENKPSITKVSVITSNSNKIQLHGKPIKISFGIEVPQKQDDLSIAFQIITSEKIPVLHFWLVSNEKLNFYTQGIYELECHIPQLNLYQGNYFLNVYLGDNKGKSVIDSVENVTPFEVVMTGLEPGHSFGWQKGTCIYRENHHWTVSNNEKYI